MSANVAAIPLLVVELARVVGHPVELVRRNLPSGAPVYLIAPIDRARLQGAFWQAARASRSGGIWSSPEAAVVGFASSADGWKAISGRTAQTCLESVLRGRLSGGPQPAAAVLADFADQGVSRDRVGRIARRIGVVRRKTGMTAGWMWALPEDQRSGNPDHVIAAGGEATT